jgi:hypothetical protein
MPKFKYQRKPWKNGMMEHWNTVEFKIQTSKLNPVFQIYPFNFCSLWHSFDIDSPSVRHFVRILTFGIPGSEDD